MTEQSTPTPRTNMDGPDFPYPDMASSFEIRYGQKWSDPDWRQETATWAAAWRMSADRDRRENTALREQLDIHLHWSQKITAAGKALSLAAQTSGGTAGADDGLQKAIASFTEALSLGTCARSIDVAEENTKLREQLASFQQSEFHPDWSLLQASQESLREHMQMLRVQREIENTLREHRDELQRELDNRHDDEISNREVARQLDDVEYQGSYADGVKLLKDRLAATQADYKAAWDTNRAIENARQNEMRLRDEAQAEAETLKAAIDVWIAKCADSQAREQGLRDALEPFASLSADDIDNIGLWAEFESANDALSTPTDTSAIDSLKKLAKFGAACLTEHRENIGDLDGGWLQDTAESTGVIVSKEVTEACGQNCTCAEVADFPQECYFIADDVQEAIWVIAQGAEGNHD